MAEKKSQAEQLKEKLFYVKKHATLVMSEQEEKKADKYCEGYKKFLDAGKTEREAAATAVAMKRQASSHSTRRLSTRQEIRYTSSTEKRRSS